MTACPWPVAQLLPHAGDAILIDTIDDWDDETLHATAVVRADGLYNDADGSLPPWMGMEIMAQAVGAWAGCQSRQCGEEVGLGFLLGTRRYECHVERFLPGTRLSVRIARSLQDTAGMGIFECELRDAGNLLAFARLNVYRPADASVFTREAVPSDEPHADPTGDPTADPTADTDVAAAQETLATGDTAARVGMDGTAYPAADISARDKAAQ